MSTANYEADAQLVLFTKALFAHASIYWLGAQNVRSFNSITHYRVFEESSTSESMEVKCLATP